MNLLKRLVMRSYQFAMGGKEAMFDAIAKSYPSATRKEKDAKGRKIADDLLPNQNKVVSEQPISVGQTPNNNSMPLTAAQYDAEFEQEETEFDRIQQDEGFDNKVYKDSLGNLTVGIGHKLKPDELKKYKEGDVFDTDVLEDMFEKDFEVARSDAEKFAPDGLPDEAMDIITNMSFQLGLPRLSTFKKFKKALKDKDFNKAADEMLDSLWASEEQTPERANRLADRMRALADKQEA